MRIVERTASVQISDGEGLDAESITLVELASRPVALLLGEPGSGKSVAMKSLYDALNTDTPESCWLIDLRDCPDLAAVRASMEETACAGARSSQKVMLLDGIDEAPGLTSAIAAYFRRTLRSLVDAGWHVIATCRSAERTAALEDAFRSFGDSSIWVLNEIDTGQIKLIIEDHEIEFEDFVVELDARKFFDILHTPFLLEQLCVVYKAGGGLPRTRRGVIEKAVELMLAEDSTVEYQPVVRTAPGPGASVGPIERRIAVERLALFAAMGDTVNVSRRSESDEREPRSIHAELVTGSESYKGKTFDIDNVDFELASKTAVFNNLGRDSSRFAHRQIRDYLAARALTRWGLPEQQVRALITISDAGGSIPPQTMDIAAWLISSSQDFDWLIDVDAFNLVRSDAAFDRPDLGLRLAQRIFDDVDAIAQNLSYADRLAGLEHPELADLLRRQLSGNQSAKYVALRILRDCAVDGMTNALLDQIADTANSIRVRKLAVSILAVSEPDALSDLSFHNPEFFARDLQGELRGEVLQALWPGRMDTAEVTRFLVIPSRDLFGAYRSFLSHFENNLTVEDARTVVRWFRSQTISNDIDGYALDLHRLISRAEFVWMSSDEDDAEIMDAIALRIINAEYRQQTLGFSRAEVSTVRWHQLVSAIVNQITQPGGAWIVLVTRHGSDGKPLVDSSDTDWIVEAILGEPSNLDSWTRLLERVADIREPTQAEALWRLALTPAWKIIGNLFNPVSLNSPTAIRERQIAAELRDAASSSAPTEQWSREQFQTILSSALNQTRNDPTRFWDVTRLLEVDYQRGRYTNKFIGDLGDAFAIELAGGLENLLPLAAAYLVVAGGQFPATLGDHSISWPVSAAYQSLSTLLIHAPHMITPSHVDVRKLTLATLRFPDFSHDDESKAQRTRVLEYLIELDETSAKAAGEEILRSLVTIVGLGATVELLRLLMTEELVTVALEVIPTLPPYERDSLLSLAAEFDLPRVLEWVRRRVHRFKDPALVAALLQMQLQWAPTEGVESIRATAIRTGDIAAEALLTLAARETVNTPGMADVPERTRIGAFEALHIRFPPAEESFAQGMHQIEPREDLAEWRNALLMSVVNAGTRDAVFEIRKLVRRHPNWDLGWAATAATERYRRSGWQPTTAEQLLTLKSRTRARLVHDPDELMEVVLNQLETIHGWLSGTTPQSFALWDETKDKRRPKSEQRISDWYAHALRTRLMDAGIVINREVEVRSATGRGVGDRLDLLIEASGSADSRPAQIIVEVKGMWNPEVKTGLRLQLGDDYLARGALTHGIYLVVDFAPGQIDDANVARAVRRNRAKLPATLQAQAEAFSPAMTIVPLIHIADLPRRMSRR